MSTLAPDPFKKSRQAGKTAIAYLAVSVFCIIFNQIYAIFGHGVSSPSMTLMFLYPGLGGSLPFLLLWLFVPEADRVKSYRLFYNSYNSGIAALTLGSLLNGIFEIAGTSSAYSIVFTAAGWAMLLFGLAAYLLRLYEKSLP